MPHHRTPAFNPRLTGLSCFSCGTVHDHRVVQNVCRVCGLPLRVDYEIHRGDLPLSRLPPRVASLWRYREVLPLAAGEVTLGEGLTPLVAVDDAHLDQGRSAQSRPGSFKARGMTAAVSMARALGAARADGAVGGQRGRRARRVRRRRASCRYSWRCRTTRRAAFVDECRHYGADGPARAGHHRRRRQVAARARAAGRVRRLDAQGAVPRRGQEDDGLRALRAARRRSCPTSSSIRRAAAPASSACGRRSARCARSAGRCACTLPRLVSACRPRAAHRWCAASSRRGAHRALGQSPTTQACGLRVPSPIGGFLCLRAIRETGGTAIAVARSARSRRPPRVLAALDRRRHLPRGRRGLGGSRGAARRAAGSCRATASSLFNTGTGLKYR